mmetsp:Transcript_12818/g.15492  ORF Transcript_12818/g.15492 Transcript_12818/m.15492 type:complete len:539 (+) Transcript_12818:2-1618(+)
MGGMNEGLKGPQVRFQLLESGNGTLGGVSALELAVVMDDCEILLKMLHAARGSGLPLATVRAWAEEVYEADRKGREGENSESSRLGHVHMGRHRGTNAQTLLQTALWCKSHTIADLLISGGADVALFDWLDSECTRMEQEDAAAWLGALKKTPDISKGVQAQQWLVSVLKTGRVKKEELHTRLVGGEAVDQERRSAVFYARSQAALSKLKVDLNTVGADGATALMLAASSLDIGWMRELLTAGADPLQSAAATCLQSWNALHFLIWAGKDGFGGKNEKLEGAAREGAELLLEHAAKRVGGRKALLASPDAEHTPLMLAVSHGADVALLELLVGGGGEGSQEALSRRTRKLSSTTHMAMEGQTPTAATLKMVLGAGKEAGGEAAKVLSAASENGTGITPLELALKHITEVWDNSDKNKHQNHPSYYGGFGGYRFGRTRRRFKVAKTPSDTTEPSVRWQCYRVLDAAVDRTVPGHRDMVSFQQVQELAQRSTDETEAKRKEEATNRGRRFGHQQNWTDNFSTPAGGPCVLKKMVNSHFYI